MDLIKVGVIGIGNMGQHHARIYAEMEQIELIGIVDINQARGKQFSERFGVTYYSDYKDLFGKVKAVNIVVPTSLHYQLAMDFLNNDIHVLVEKPITIDLNQAKKLVELADERNLILQVGHLERFNPAVGQLKKMIKKPLYIETHRLSFPTKRNLDVGVVWDLMIHDLDILLNIVDSPVEELHSLGSSLYSDHEDLALVQIRFKNGTLANLFASRVSGEKLRQLKVIEENRTLGLDFINQTLAILRPPKRDITSPPEYVPIKRAEPLRVELEHFAECVVTNRTPIVTGEDGKRALALAMQVLDNMRMVKDKGIIYRELMAVAR